MLLPVLLSLLAPANAFPTLHSLFTTTTIPETEEPGEEPGSPEFWYKLIVSVGLVLAGGVFAGSVLLVPPSALISSVQLFSLTLGLMGLDELHLRVLSASSDDPKERKNAQKGTSQHHLLQYTSVLIYAFPSLELAFKGSPLGPCRTFASICHETRS